MVDAATASVEELRAAADGVLAYARRYDFAGHDPFDGLNSRLFGRLPISRIPLARLAWLQLHKRLPVNLRSLVGVPRVRNAKGVALFVLGLIEDERLSPSEVRREEIRRLADWLCDESVAGDRWPGKAWGYPFPWQARAFHVPLGTPNAITTVYVAQALYAVTELLGDKRYANAAVAAGVFLDSLFVDSTTPFYRYIPGEDAFVHNASLWSAAMVAEAGRRLGDEKMLARAAAAARQSVTMQRPDGAWLYGTRSHHAFIDSFHTGYNLEALARINAIVPVAGCGESVEKGIVYFRSAFVEPDGAIRYYAGRRYPLDTHCVAQAIITLLAVGDGWNDLALCRNIATWSLRELYVPRLARFAYQRHRFLANHVTYLRWTQAWIYRALAALIRRVAS